MVPTFRLHCKKHLHVSLTSWPTNFLEGDYHSGGELRIETKKISGFPENFELNNKRTFKTPMNRFKTVWTYKVVLKPVASANFKFIINILIKIRLNNDYIALTGVSIQYVRILYIIANFISLSEIQRSEMLVETNYYIWNGFCDELILTVRKFKQNHTQFTQKWYNLILTIPGKINRAIISCTNRDSVEVKPYFNNIT